LRSTALEHIPNSVRLWKETVNLEESAADARILLARAVEVIPMSVELWLALARLETPDRAKAVLNKARKAVPTSHEIWIAAGRLLEQEAISPQAPEIKTEEQKTKELDMVDRTIELGVRELRKHQVLLTRDQWLKEAEKCESQGSLRTCEAIVKATVAMEIEEEDRLDTWVGDAENAESRGMVGTARAILAYALKVYPDRRGLWRRAAELEKTHGTRYSTRQSSLHLINGIFACSSPGKVWILCSVRLSSIVPKRRFFGLWLRKRNGWLETFLLLAKFSSARSTSILRVKRFGWPLSSLSQKTVTWMLPDNCFSAPETSLIRTESASRLFLLLELIGL